jgi:hypothetical protein
MKKNGALAAENGALAAENSALADGNGAYSPLVRALWKRICSLATRFACKELTIFYLRI